MKNILYTAFLGTLVALHGEIITPTELPTKLEAVKFLQHSTFGANRESVTEVMDKGFDTWINNQFTMPSVYDAVNDDRLSHLEATIKLAKEHEPNAYTASISDYVSGTQNTAKIGDAIFRRVYYVSAWYQNALNSQEQLRQRVMYALSQLYVIAPIGTEMEKSVDALAHYNDILGKHAFGNVRELLSDIARSPQMGLHLTYQGNKKADENHKPDENFARELMQLFTIGLYKMLYNGQAKLDENGSKIEVYTTEDVKEMARVATGWNLNSAEYCGQSYAKIINYSQMMDTTRCGQFHDYGEKRILGKKIPAGLSPEKDMEAALDIFFTHRNAPSFFAKHMIKHLVTSNPSQKYVKAVSKAFVDNGNGVRGDMKAILKAVLLDKEARVYRARSSFGKGKEHLIAFTQLLRALDVQPLSTTEQNPLTTYMITSSITPLMQEPLKSPTVFNFFAPDFIPIDENFSNKELVAPEFDIRGDQFVVKYHNFIQKLLFEFEKVGGKNPEFNYTSRKAIFQTDFTYLLEYFEQVLDGDTNGDYVNFNDAVKKEKAIKKTVDYLNMHLTGNNISISQKRLIVEELMGGKTLYSDTPYRVIKDAVLIIGTLNVHLVQR